MWHKFHRLWQLLRHPETFCECSTGRTCIGFVPWWPGTYYQARLVKELQAQGLFVHGNELSVKTLVCLLFGRDCNEVIHVHWPHGTYLHNYWRFPFVVFHLWLYRLLKNNIVWTVHELEFYETRYPALDRMMVHLLVRIARALIVHSEYSIRVLRDRHRYRREIVLLRHPGHVDCFPNDIGREAARAELGLPATGTVYLFLGFIKPYKGVEELIDVFGNIDDPQSRLLIVGKPLNEETRERIETLARRDTRILTHLAFVPDDRLQIYMNAADISVFPFRKMHTSGSMHLAMSYSRPVIAPAIASLPEEIDAQAGLLFDANDPGGLSAAMRAARDKDLRAMGQHARERLNGRTWPAFAAQHVLLYQWLDVGSGWLPTPWLSRRSPPRTAGARRNAAPVRAHDKNRAMRRKIAKLFRIVRGSEPCCKRIEGKLNVGFIPWWPSTFYQARLARELQSMGAHVHGHELSIKSLVCLLLRRDCDDVIHVHWPHGAYMHNYWRAPFVVFHLWLYRLLKNNVVWTVHELEFYETRHPLLDRWVVRSLLRLSRTLIVHSDYSAEVLHRRYRYGREIRVLRHPSYVGCYPNDVDNETARKTLGVRPDATVYLFFGHIKPYKGVEELLKAFRGIDDPRLCLVVAGEPIDEAVSRRIRSLAMDDARVMAHLGFLPDERLQHFLNAADVLVFPFRKMHTSGSVLLAMSFARPVIAPRMAALPEEVDEKSGILFDPDDPQALRSALLSARDKDLAQMGRRARERMEGRTWEEFASSHLRAYHAVTKTLERRPTPPSETGFLGRQDVKVGYHRPRR
jgi:beta-1,4-mannosyltransferase